MALLFLTTLVFLTSPQPGGAIQVTPKEDGTRVEVSAVLPKEASQKLSAGKVAQDAGELWLQFQLVVDGKAGPTMLGSYQRQGEKLIFVPRLPLQPDKTYRASLLGPGDKVASTVNYKVPARPLSPSATVSAVWPAGDVLPANHLRFYIQFTRPMRGGPDIFEQIYLLDADGSKIEDPWLHEELWNEDGTVLSLLIHPGRIKWGVLLRTLLGPVLEPDRTYTLVVGSDFLDADERKLAKEFRKKFRTTAEDRTRIDLSTWKLETVQVGGRNPVTLAFPKAIDRRCAEQFLQVVDAKGTAVAGKIEVDQEGRNWKFVPAAAWADQEYKIKVDGRLEDVAGNTPVHPFDVDADAPVPPEQRLWLTFRPRT